MFEAYVTNLGLYPERGAGAGEYLRFPTTAEEVQTLFSRIGIDGKQYEEYFITDYDSDILGLTDHLGEYESLDELNYLAHLLEEMTPAELEKLEAVMDGTTSLRRSSHPNPQAESAKRRPFALCTFALSR